MSGNNLVDRVIPFFITTDDNIEQINSELIGKSPSLKPGLFVYNQSNYDDIKTKPVAQVDSMILDHLDGFEGSVTNPILDNFSKHLTKSNKLVLHMYVGEEVKRAYPTLNIEWDSGLHEFCNDQVRKWHNEPIIPYSDIDQFVSCLMGSYHVSRLLLVSALAKLNLLNWSTCSKGFVYDPNEIDGEIQRYCGELEPYYRRFFTFDTDLANKTQVFGEYGDLIKINHDVLYLDTRQIISKSFVNIVSESIATSYYPVWTEKFLYSVASKRFFVAHAGAGWHNLIHNTFGFKPYRIFDYSFDTEPNPVIRLIKLLEMLQKFSVLSRQDWHDLYMFEHETIEFNYDHYYSKNYLKNYR